MQYEDDFDDQNLYLEKNRNRKGRRNGDEGDSSDDDEEPTKKANQPIAGKTQILQNKSGQKSKQP